MRLRHRCLTTVAACFFFRSLVTCFLPSVPPLASQPVRLKRRDHALHWLAATGFAPAADASPSDAACIREAAKALSQKDPVLAPSLLRLAFHDAATRRPGDARSQGPNGSIRFELLRDENYGPPMKAALAAVEEIVQRCQVTWADAAGLALACFACVT